MMKEISRPRNFNVLRPNRDPFVKNATFKPLAANQTHDPANLVHCSVNCTTKAVEEVNLKLHSM